MPSQQAANLKPEALGLSESVIMGVAGTAPAFSIAATTAALVGTVGVLAPATLLCAGIAMFGIASAFLQLNRLDPNAGASYAWVSRIFNRTLGFFAGWALLLASVVFMVSGTIPAASATLALLAPGQADNPVLVTAVAAGWLIAVGAVVLEGIKLTSIVQIVMTGVELVILLVIAAVALVKFGAQPQHPFSLAWFDPGGFTPQLFAAGAVIAIFFYWGWDVTANLNEETRNARQAAGLGAVISMLLVLALFLLFTAVSLLALSDTEIARAGANVIFAVAEKLFPPPWSGLAVLAVMLSTIGTLETTILQFTRTMFAKGRVPHPLRPAARAMADAVAGDVANHRAGAGLAAAVELQQQHRHDPEGFDQRHRLPGGLLLRHGGLRLRLALPEKRIALRLAPAVPGAVARLQRAVPVGGRTGQPAQLRLDHQAGGDRWHAGRLYPLAAATAPPTRATLVLISAAAFAPHILPIGEGILWHGAAIFWTYSIKAGEPSAVGARQAAARYAVFLASPR